MPDFLPIKKLLQKVNAAGSGGGGGGGMGGGMGGGGGGGGGGKGRFGGGIGGGIGNLGPMRDDGDEDRLDRLSLILRGLQIFFALVMLLIAIVIASFQSKWVGGPSGLTGFLLFISIASLLTSVVFVVVPIVYERSDFKTFKGVHRAIKEARVGFVANGVWTALTLITAVTQTISAYTSAGCKDVSKDPNADKGEDFKKGLSGFCRDKRAESAFVWFLWITWLLTLLLFLRSWRVTRKNGPRIPPFVHPTDDSAFEPIGAGDDIDEDDRGDYRAGGRYGEGGDGRYGAAYDDMPGGYGYGAQRPNSVADIEARYGMNSAAAARRDTYDPFADSAAAPGPRPSHDYGAYSDAPPTGFVSGPQRRDTGPQDPYSAIRNQLAYSDTPDRPPQLPDLGYGR